MSDVNRYCISGHDWDLEYADGGLVLSLDDYPAQFVDAKDYDELKAKYEALLQEIPKC